jgi:hypothetical protein
MKVEFHKVPIAWKLQLTIEALIPEFRQLRDLLEENRTFIPDLIPLLEELNLALTGWRELINGPCGSSELQNIGTCERVDAQQDKPLIVFDETLNRVVEIDKNQLGVYGKGGEHDETQLPDIDKVYCR